MYRLLEGIKVIEFGLLLNGDQLGMYLADLGAEVIKIEDVARGDYIRDILGQIAPHHSPAHLQANKNKKSLALDVRNPEGRALFFELLATADIFIDGLRPGACEGLGVGYEAQKAVNPDIVYVQYTGYGARGPYANIPTHGYQMSALAGAFPARIGEDGRPIRTRGVQYMGGTEESSSPSGLGAQFAAMAALAAVIRKQRGGGGAYIDVAASDAVVASCWMGMVYNLNYDRITDFNALAPKQESYEARWPNGSSRYQLYQTKDDKLLLVGFIEPKFWTAFCKAVGREELIDTIRPGHKVDFGEDKAWLRDEVAGIIATRTLEEWTGLAAALGIPMGPAHRLEDVPSDPHIRTRGLFLEEQVEGVGPFTYIGFPAIVDGENYPAPVRAPRHGEHSAEILASIDVDETALARLRAHGIVKKA